MVEDKVSILLEIIGEEEASASISDLEKRLDSLGRAFGVGTKFEGLEKLGVSVGKAGRLFDTYTGLTVTDADIIQRKLDGVDLSKIEEIDWGKAKDGISAIAKTADGTSKILMHLRNSALFFGLGMMFMGMAIKRLMEGIARDTVGTFMKITEGQTEAGRSLTILNANFEYLKFTIGDAIASAIMPLVPLLVEIILKVADWVENNKTLVGGIFVAAIILGTFMIIIGQLTTFLAALTSGYGGLLMAMKAITPFIAVGSWTAMTTAIGGVVAAIGPISALLIAIVAIVLVLKAVWDTNFGGIRDVTTTIFAGIGSFIGAIFGDIGKILGDFYSLWVAIFSGNTDVAKDMAYNILLTIAGMLVRIGGLVGMLFDEILTFAIKATIQIIGVVVDIAASLFGMLMKLVALVIAGIINSVIGKIVETYNTIAKLFGKQQIVAATITVDEGKIDEYVNFLKEQNKTRVASALLSADYLINPPWTLDEFNAAVTEAVNGMRAANEVSDDTMLRSIEATTAQVEATTSLNTSIDDLNETIEGMQPATIEINVNESGGMSDEQVQDMLRKWGLIK